MIGVLMCGFEFCKGKHKCFLAKTSPCREYENAKALEELSQRMRRPNSRPGAGFVDVEDPVTLVTGRRTTTFRTSRPTI